jgi:hypothetical protein
VRLAAAACPGPDVLVENVPYGMPGREVFVAEYLKDAGYKTHAIGKVGRTSTHTPVHHLGAPTPSLPACLPACQPAARACLTHPPVPSLVYRAQWHLGKCDNRYMATYRGFDSYMGYLDGTNGYWRHSGDYRNSSSLLGSAGETPACATSAEVDGLYSTTLETAEIDRITVGHPEGSPLFIYMALHSVHGPNE